MPMLTKYAVDFRITQDRTETVVIVAYNSNHAVKIAREELEAEYGRVANRHGVVETIVQLNG